MARIGGVDKESRLGGFFGVGWLVSRERVGEPDFIVLLLDVQVALQGMGKGNMAMIKVAEVRAVNWGARGNASRDGQEHVARTGKGL
jgi:hypothetical protein